MSLYFLRDNRNLQREFGNSVALIQITSKNQKGAVDMTTVLTLQKLATTQRFIDLGNVFGSAISTVCPGHDEATAKFEME